MSNIRADCLSKLHGLFWREYYIVMPAFNSWRGNNLFMVTDNIKEAYDSMLL